MTITTFAKDRLQHLQNSSNSPLDEYEVTEERSYFTQGPEYVVIKVHPHTQTQGKGGGELRTTVAFSFTFSLLFLSHITFLCQLTPFFSFLILPCCFNLPSHLLPSLCPLSTLCFPVPSPPPRPLTHLLPVPSPPPVPSLICSLFPLLPPSPHSSAPCSFSFPLSQIDHAVVASLFTDSRGHETLAASHRQLRGFLIDVDGDIMKELSPEPGKPDKVGSSAIMMDN